MSYLLYFHKDLGTFKIFFSGCYFTREMGVVLIIHFLDCLFKQKLSSM